MKSCARQPQNTFLDDRSFGSSAWRFNHENRIALVFSHPSASCAGMVPEVCAWHPRLPHRAVVRLYSGGEKV